MDNFIRNNTHPETSRDSTGLLSRQELIDNNNKLTRARRVFKVVPVKTNQRWNKKFSVRPEVHDTNQDIPVAIIVAAKTDLRNLNIKNESRVPLAAVDINNTESETQNVDVENYSHVTNNSPYEDNGIEHQVSSNLGQSVGNFQNIVSKVPHLDESKEEAYETKNVKDASKIDAENDNENSKERNVENTPVLEILGKDPLDNVDDHNKVTNKNLCHISETNIVKSKCSTEHNEFHKFLKELHQDSRKRDFNVFFFVKD